MNPCTTEHDVSKRKQSYTPNFHGLTIAQPLTEYAPLHPRCRCVIVYREAGKTPANPKPRVVDETAIRAKLEAVKTKLKIRGDLLYPPPKLDLSAFVFDAVHTQGDRHPHDVTEAEARRFVTEAYFALHLNAKNTTRNFAS